MHTHAKEMPLWQLAALVALAAALVLGLSAVPAWASKAYAADGQLVATSLTDNGSDLATAAKAKSQTVKVTTDGYMFAVKTKSKVLKDGNKVTLRLCMDSSSFDAAYNGKAAKAVKASESDYVQFNAKNKTFDLDVPEGCTDGSKAFVASFRSARYHKKGQNKFYDRWFILNLDKGTLYIAHTNVTTAAKRVDKMIKKIQEQEWTSDTDLNCKRAKAAWDKLPKPVRGLMEEYDYFGLNTGKASKDNPLNQDNIGKNEILVVSFGTSFNNSRVATIGGVEKAIQKAYPKWSVRRAFTAQIIINHIQARDGEKIDNMKQALDRSVANGVKNLVVAPTHLMHGAEYDELVAALKPYQKKMNIKISEPLLGPKSKSATKINSDKKTVAKAVVAAAVKDAGFKNQAAMDKAGTALVLMGHGTSHEANVTYTQMQTQMAKLGYDNVFVGTVEGEPEGTDAQAIIAKVKAAGYKNVILRPLMVVAGDHANNDMADPDDPESWYSQFKASKSFKSIKCQIKGLGQIKGVQKLYVNHVKAVIK